MNTYFMLGTLNGVSLFFFSFLLWASLPHKFVGESFIPDMNEGMTFVAYFGPVMVGFTSFLTLFWFMNRGRSQIITFALACGIAYLVPLCARKLAERMQYTKFLYDSFMSLRHSVKTRAYVFFAGEQREILLHDHALVFRTGILSMDSGDPASSFILGEPQYVTDDNGMICVKIGEFPDNYKQLAVLCQKSLVRFERIEIITDKGVATFRS